MKLVLNTLPRGRSEQIFDSIAQLQHDETMEWKPLDLELILGVDRQAQNLYLSGKLKCRGLFICDSGMEEFEDKLDGNFEVILTYNPEYLEDYETDEIILVKPHQSEFDLYPLVREALLLAIPISHACGPDCEAGKVLRKSLETETEPDDRWAKLKDMFNQ